jgi:hypothetical protein
MKKLGGLLKKLGIALLVLIAIGAVFGGGSNDKPSKTSEPAAQEQSEETSGSDEKASAESDDKEEAQAEEPAEEADEGPSIATNSKYAVTINGYELTEDYDGAPAIAISYTFTNVSDDNPTSMDLATNITVYQDGLECERAYFASDDGDNSSSKVKAGKSIDVTLAYKLVDTTSDVEVEVGQLFSWNDDLLAYEVFKIA